MPGDTRVGLSLVALADQKHQRLTDISENWLRRSLTNEMAWIKLTLHELLGDSSQDIDTWLRDRKLSDSECEAVKYFFASQEHVGDYCSAASIESLLALSAGVGKLDPPIVLEVGVSDTNAPSAAVAAGNSDLLEELKDRSRVLNESIIEIDKYRGVQDLSDELYVYFKELNDLGRSLKRIIADFGQIPARLRPIAELILTTDVRGRMNRLRDYTKDKSLAALIQEYSDWEAKARTMFRDPLPSFVGRYDAIAEAKILLHPLRRATQVLGPLQPSAEDGDKPDVPDTGDWRMISQWRRLTRDEARASIDKLTEAQVVLETILSSEWENNGWGMRWKLGDSERPDHSLPVSTIGPDSTHNSWSLEQGLSVWPEKRDDRNIWEFVARREDTKVRKERKDT